MTELRRLKLAAGAGDPDAGVALLGVLRPLTGSVSCVSTSAHEALLREALDLPLWRVAPEVRAAALDLVLHLAAAVGAAVQPCLQTLVHALLPPPGPPAPDTLGQAWAPAPGSLQIQDEVIETLGKVGWVDGMGGQFWGRGLPAWCLWGPSREGLSEAWNARGGWLPWDAPPAQNQGPPS